MKDLLKANAYQPETALADAFSDNPGDSFLHKYLLGIIIPLCISIYAALCIITKHGVLIGSDSPDLIMNGKIAVFYGIACASIAMHFHFHFYWVNHKRLFAYAYLGKLLALIALIISLGYVIWNVTWH
jgi:hypothetical protein